MPRIKPKPLINVSYEKNKKRFYTIVTVFITVMLALMAFWYLLPPLDVEETAITSVRQQLGDNPLKVEVLYANGTSPTLSALGVLEQRIRTYSLNGDIRDIDFSMRMFEPEYSTYYFSNLKAVEDDYRMYENTENQSALFIMYCNGRYARAEAVGYAYGDSSYAIFQETIIDYLEGNTVPVSLHSFEASILVHEWGHIIGLVNIGYESNVPGHHDASHPFHSTSPKSVMHYAVEFIGITGEPPTDFSVADQRDIIDLKQSAGLSSSYELLQYRLDRWKWELSTVILVFVAIVLTSWLWYVRGCRRVCSRYEKD